MAKKTKDDVPNPNNVTNREILQRMNFLYQASALLNHINAPSSSKQPEVSKPVVREKEQKTSKKATKQKARLTRRRPRTCEDLSKSYIQTMKAVGLKTNVRLCIHSTPLMLTTLIIDRSDPSVKRTLCKECNVVLIPGSTAHIRVNPSKAHGNAVIYTCLSCKHWRRIPAPPVLEPEELDNLIASISEPTESLGEDTMAIDVPQKKVLLPESISKLPRRKQRQARLAPLFERKVGHVVFRGNERLPDDH
ncbi:hypothetical protein QCA50_003977 [Cerrena zonata]|uniref:Rpr2-domain-containing protein n=1 Tax=Cerrena zonata TaxID=2478898 RepID=A0AAW0GQV7_9APHY